MSVERESRPSATEMCLPPPPYFPFGDSQTLSSISFELILRILFILCVPTLYIDRRLSGFSGDLSRRTRGGRAAEASRQAPGRTRASRARERGFERPSPLERRTSSGLRRGCPGDVAGDSKFEVKFGRASGFAKDFVGCSDHD